MLNFIKNKAKYIFILYLIILFGTLLFGTYYSTQYANIHLAYNIDDTTKELEINKGSIFTFGPKNKTLWDYFEKSTDKIEELDYLYGYDSNKNSNFETSGVKNDIYDFQMGLSNFSTEIIIFTFISILVIVLLFAFGNHSRKVYYKSNLFIGILVPIVVITFATILLIKNSSLMSMFMANETLYKVVGVLMQTNLGSVDERNYRKDHQSLLDAGSSINNTSFIILDILLLIVIVFSILVIAYTIFRYLECKNRRNEIIERAAKNND